MSTLILIPCATLFQQALQGHHNFFDDTWSDRQLAEAYTRLSKVPTERLRFASLCYFSDVRLGSSREPWDRERRRRNIDILVVLQRKFRDRPSWWHGRTGLTDYTFVYWPKGRPLPSFLDLAWDSSISEWEIGRWAEEAYPPSSRYLNPVNYFDRCIRLQHVHHLSDLSKP